MLEFQEALQSIQKGSHAPVYLLLGTERVLMQQLITTIGAQNALNNEGQLIRHNFDEEGCEAALLSCQTLSFFGVPVVVLQHCTAFLATGKSTHSTTALEQYLENPIPDRTLIITVLADKWDERKKLTKLAKKHVVIRCQIDKEDAALRLLGAMVNQSNFKIQAEAMQELWRRTHSISMAEVELQKLQTYAIGRSIVQADVEALVAAPLEDNVFTWIDSVVKGDLATAFMVIQNLTQAGNDAIGLVALIARQLRIMWFAKVLSQQGQSTEQIAARVSAHPYAVKVALNQSRRFSAERVEQLLKNVADAEYQMKTGRRDVTHALEWIVMSCAVTTAGERRAQ